MKNPIMKKAAFCLLAAAGCFSCSRHPSLPSSFTQSEAAPVIFPDYRDVTVPPNIAPLNFLVDSVDDVVAEFKTQGAKLNYGGRNSSVQIDEDEWRELLTSAKGKSIAVTVYTKRDGKWTAYKPFPIHVAVEAT